MNWANGSHTRSVPEGMVMVPASVTVRERVVSPMYSVPEFFSG